MTANLDCRPLSATTVPGWQVEYVDATRSTNADALARPEPGRVVVTDHQSAGRGRLGRSWEAPPGVALTFSAVVAPGVPDQRWPWLPLLAGLAVAEGVRRATGLAAGLKWPNDVLVGDRKLAGILVERLASSRLPLAVVGIGVNVHQRVLPVPGATSLSLEGAPVDRAVLLEAVLSALKDLLSGWRGAAGDPGTLRQAYLDACVTPGHQVRVDLPGGETLSGLAESIDAMGRLVVLSGQTRRAIGAGDVIHARRSDQA